MKLTAKCSFCFVLILGLLPCVANAVDHYGLACVGGTVYPSPTGRPIRNAVLAVSNGKIDSVVEGTATGSLPKGGRQLDCAGKFIVAGFWNSHAHFETGWQNAAEQPAEKLESHMQDMLTRWGVTAVWDLGSEVDNTLALRGRVESGEVPGPEILIAGDIFPKNGHPAYLPAEMQTPEAATPQEAERMTRQYMKMGFDGLKLFTGSYMGAKPVVNMDTAIVKAAVGVAHAQGKPVFTHPQNRSGVDNALAGGVDILAHTIPWEGHYTEDELTRMKHRDVALIPTLMEWTTVVSDPAVTDRLVQAGVDELKSYFYAGGTILFGTDVGFQSGSDTTQEFEFMGRAMGWKDILASLTTNPAAYFKATTKGRVEKGMDADFVVLDADPAADVKNLAKVKYTIRGGSIIYSKK
jgi:imidazolonepropionase-like amidohydrolase